MNGEDYIHPSGGLPKASSIFSGKPDHTNDELAHQESNEQTQSRKTNDKIGH